METNQHPDKVLIESLGGPSKLARTLGIEKHGPQRVHNWSKRGIPASVKLARPDLFLQIKQVSPNYKV